MALSAAPIARRSIARFNGGAQLAFMLLVASVAISPAQELTANPGAWRPLVRADLATEKPDNLTYIDIWKDVLAANNRAYDAKGAARTPGENAPATDAHIVIRSAERTIVLSTIDAATVCKPSSFAVSVKMCPTRLVIFEGPVGKTKDLPSSCYLEINSATTPDLNAYGAYAAYDTITKTIKLGLILDHRPIDECARFIPTSP